MKIVITFYPQFVYFSISSNINYGVLLFFGFFRGISKFKEVKLSKIFYLIEKIIEFNFIFLKMF